MQHGGPVMGIFGREIEKAAVQTDMQVARLTMDLFKAIPMETLVAETQFERRGKRIAAITSTLRPVNGEARAARASGLLLRTRQYDSPFKGNSEYPLCLPPLGRRLEGKRTASRLSSFTSGSILDPASTIRDGLSG